MIDYAAAGFTLLQGAHLYAPEDRGNLRCPRR